MSSRILVTDGEQRTALALVRALGAAGHEVFVTASRDRSLAGSSGFAAGRSRVAASSLADPAGYATEIAELVRRWAIEVLIPVTEPSLLALLAAQDDLRGVRIPFADLEAFRRVSDKELLLRTAAELGIAVPAQVVVPSADAARSFDPGDIPFPVVLKPARSVSEGGGQRLKLSVEYATDAGELRRRLRDLPPAAFPLLLQQRVVGPGVGIFLLISEGRPLAVFAHRRIRETPPSGGVSVYRESIAADPALARLSQALLERLGWQGVAMVEYKLDAATGTPYLMEVNGRFWGSLQLAIDAGVNFPDLLVRAALEQPVEPVTSYRTGVRSRWWWGEVNHLLARLRPTPAHLALPPDAPSRARAILDFFTLWRPGDRGEIFRWNDPAPVLRETLDWFARR